MQAVRVRGTNLEIRLTEALGHRGLRFEQNASDLPGKPDVVFRKRRVAIFVDGDFWHGYRFPEWEHQLSPFWQEKIRRTRVRDQRNFRKLRYQKWTVLRIWQHEIVRDLPKAIEKIVSALAKTSQ